MSISNSRLAYTDCYAVYDRALEESEGVRVRMESYNAAVFFRMRMHQARTVNRRDNTQTYEPGDPMYGRSEYDALMVRIKQVGDQVYVYVEPGGIDVEGSVEAIPADDDAVPIHSGPMREPSVPEMLGRTEKVVRRL